LHASKLEDSIVSNFGSQTPRSLVTMTLQTPVDMISSKDHYGLMDMFSHPLTHVFKIHLQGYPWHFSHECHSMFEALKKAFITALDLTHCILDTAIPVETHTSDNPPTSASISTPNYKLHPLHSTYRPSPLWNSTMRYSEL